MAVVVADRQLQCLALSYRAVAVEEGESLKPVPGVPLRARRQGDVVVESKVEPEGDGLHGSIRSRSHRQRPRLRLVRQVPEIEPCYLECRAQLAVRLMRQGDLPVGDGIAEDIEVAEIEAVDLPDRIHAAQFRAFDQDAVDRGSGGHSA